MGASTGYGGDEDTVSGTPPDIEEMDNANKGLESGHEPVYDYVQ